MSQRMERVTGRRRRGRRRMLGLTGALGGLGLALGIGAAGLTTAAWTDLVWWAGAVETGMADLQGSLDGVTWVDSDDEGAVELVIPTIADLRPGDTITTTIHLRNAGTLPADLTGVAAGTGALFQAPAPVTASLSGLPATIAGGSATTATLSIAAPEWTGQQHMGESGAVTVSVTGAVP